jgi:hypothetical protein
MVRIVTTRLQRVKESNQKEWDGLHLKNVSEDEKAYRPKTFIRLRFAVHAAVKIKITIVCGVMLCSLVGRYHVSEELTASMLKL